MVRSSVLVLLSMLWASTVADGFEVAGEISGENDGDQYGAAICAVDFNGDGHLDMAVGAPANDDAGTSSGKVYLYFGGPSADTVADLTFVGDPSSFFGKSLSSAGDFNNDGYDDLLVGAPFYDVPATSAGAVYLFYGGPSADVVADHIFTGQNGSDYFGIAVTGAGDFNNDSYDDFAVGAYYNDWGGFTKAGKVYVYLGGPSPDFAADLILVGTADGERFGFAISSQDYDGDSYSDLSVGAYSYDAAYLNQGRVYVFSGGSSVDTIPDLIITGDSAGYKFGWSLASGKVSGDSYWDLIMGSDGVSIDTFSVGEIYVFNGGPSFDGVADYSYNLGRLKHDYLGFDVASSADVNGDGFDEIIAGMPGNDDGGTDAGGALLFDGGPSVVVDTNFLGSSSGQEMGKAVGFWEDFGAGGAVAIAVGASSSDNYRGSLLLYHKAGGSENAPPVLDPIGPKFGVVGTPVIFTVTASDPDGTVPALSAPDLPTGADFEDYGDGSGLFSWTLVLSDTGTHSVTFIASDESLSDSEVVDITIADSSSCCLLRGDLDHSGVLNIGDLTYMVAYLFTGGVPPPCYIEGDIDNNSSINIGDLTYLVAFLFTGGPLPLPCP
ncbi:MAG: FG-GAP repeat protein [candidate division Zixibacteria bacterium]|nr:FG-GAP repeat protein [candidate division Zixibacteria bacterium]